MTKYLIINNFPIESNTFLLVNYHDPALRGPGNLHETSPIILYPGDSKCLWLPADIQVTPMSGEEEIPSQISFDTKTEITYRLSLKRQGNHWIMQDILYPNFSLQQDVPPVQVKVGPGGQ